MDVKPKKYLGQHFLLDGSVSKRISESLFIEKKRLLSRKIPICGLFQQKFPEIGLFTIRPFFLNPSPPKYFAL